MRSGLIAWTIARLCGRAGDPPLGLQRTHRFADRDARYSEVLGERDLIELNAVLKHTALNRAPQRVRDLRTDALPFAQTAAEDSRREFAIELLGQDELIPDMLWLDFAHGGGLLVKEFLTTVSISSRRPSSIP